MDLQFYLKGLSAVWRTPNGPANIPKLKKQLQNSSRQKGDMKQSHSEGPQTLGSAIQVVVTRETQRPGFMHPRNMFHFNSYDFYKSNGGNGGVAPLIVNPFMNPVNERVYFGAY
jgi:hypothetical protein